MDPKKSLPLIPPVDDVAVARPDAVPEVPVSVAPADPVTPKFYCERCKTELVPHGSPKTLSGPLCRDCLECKERHNLVAALNLDYRSSVIVELIMGWRYAEAIWHLQQLEKANQ